MSEPAYIWLCIALAVLGYFWSYVAGRKHGEAIGWQNGFFHCLRNNVTSKQRRDSLGRFSAKDAPRDLQLGGHK